MSKRDQEDCRSRLAVGANLDIHWQIYVRTAAAARERYAKVSSASGCRGLGRNRNKDQDSQDHQAVAMSNECKKSTGREFEWVVLPHTLPVCDG